jgi:ribonuclease J
VHETFTHSETQVEDYARGIIKKTEKLVVCSFPTRDLDRLLSFYNAAKASQRKLVIDLRQAYLLKLFQTSEQWKNVYPAPDDRYIQVYVPRKSWGLLGKDLTYWTDKLLVEDYKEWEREFLDYNNRIDHRGVSLGQKELVFCCNDFQLKELIDVRPGQGSQYIRSTTEPFDDEMELSENRAVNWLIHFGLITKKGQLSRSHVSGHGDGNQIKAVVEGSKAKKLIPIHTEKEQFHKKWHTNVKTVKLNGSVALQ